jgi:predicted aldo/keto reductase-like oxidoreductase
MLYRWRDRTGTKLPIPGCGCMRLPQTADGAINKREATAGVRYTITIGVDWYGT